MTTSPPRGRGGRVARAAPRPGVSPELRNGSGATVVLAVVTAVGKLAVPILIQQILDRGVLGERLPPRLRALAVPAPRSCSPSACSSSAGPPSSASSGRPRQTLCGLRVARLRAHPPAELADHNDDAGAACSRVAGHERRRDDGAVRAVGRVAWIVDSVLIVGTLVVMLVYSWQLALVTIVAYRAAAPPILRLLQRRQLRAYDEVRTRGRRHARRGVRDRSRARRWCGPTASQDRARDRLREPSTRRTAPRCAPPSTSPSMFPLGDLFGAIALAGIVVAVGVLRARAGASTSATLVAFVFLVNLLLIPIAELSEILDQTQTAIAGWRKVLDVLDIPIDVVEPDPTASHLAARRRSPSTSRASSFAYRDRRAGAARHRPGPPGRHARRRRRRDRLGQDHLRQAAVPARRSDRRARSRSAASTCREVAPASPAPRGPHGAAGRLPVRHHARATTCASAAPDATDDEVEPPSPPSGSTGGSTPARRPRHRGRRAGREPVGRRAPARRARPRPARRPRPADPRRGHDRGRPRDRAGAHRRAGRVCARAAPT